MPDPDIADIADTEIADTVDTVETPLMDELDSAAAELPPPVAATFPESEDNAPKAATESAPETTPESLLTLEMLAGALEVTYPRLRGMVDKPGMKELLSAVKAPGFKGVRYPSSAIGILRAVVDAQDRGELTPATAVSWLQRKQGTEASGASSASDGDVEPEMVGEEPAASPDVPAGAIATVATALAQVPTAGPLALQLIAALQENSEALRLNAETTPPEKFYGLAAAAEATGLSQKTIKDNVPYVLDGTRRKWAAVDLKAYQMRVRRHEPAPSKPGRSRPKSGPNTESADS